MQIYQEDVITNLEFKRQKKIKKICVSCKEYMYNTYKEKMHIQRERLQRYNRSLVTKIEISRVWHGDNLFLFFILVVSNGQQKYFFFKGTSEANIKWKYNPSKYNKSYYILIFISFLYPDSIQFFFPAGR